MIVVRVELWSARTGQRTELARMNIFNVSGGGRRRDYQAMTLQGRSTAGLNRGRVHRSTSLTGWRSLDLHVWNLVSADLGKMGYGDPATTKGGAR